MSFFALGGGSWGRRLGTILLVILASGWSVEATAQSVGTMVVQNDRGGPVGARAREIAHLNMLRRRVELRGSICHSSCTMYLGADYVCISPNTTFGFHGPTRKGAQLETESFEYWTTLMAKHYNEPLRRWFMSTGRHRINGVHRISGTQLIALGYNAC